VKSEDDRLWMSVSHHHLRVVLTDRCAVPWPPKISVLHRDESGIVLASSLTRLSQVRRRRHGGLVDGFLPSWLSPSRFAGTSLQGPNVQHGRKRDRRRLRRIPLIVDKPQAACNHRLNVLCIDDERLYGFARIDTGDELSKRVKFVLVTWVGVNVGALKRAKMSIDKSVVKTIITVPLISDTLCPVWWI